MASSSSSTSSAGSAPTPRPPRQQLRGAAAAAASSPVFLNVYDVTPANGYARWLGLGVYHSGVQVHGVEYAYGAHEGAGSGIFEVAPRRCPGYAFREAVLVGTTELTRAEVRALMADLAADFPGDAYNLVSRNCNHFCDAACRRLVRARIPRWVNRLAKIGLVFTCVIPGNGKPVSRKGEPAAGGKAGVRSRSARQAVEASAPPRPRTFFRSLSVGGSKNVTLRPLSTSPSLPPAPASTSTSSASTEVAARWAGSNGLAVGRLNHLPSGGGVTVAGWQGGACTVDGRRAAWWSGSNGPVVGPGRCRPVTER